MCPICSTPVTLGGGITMQKGSRLSGSEWNSPCSIQYAYHLSSTSEGLYLVANSLMGYKYAELYYGAKLQNKDETGKKEHMNNIGVIVVL